MTNTQPLLTSREVAERMRCTRAALAMMRARGAGPPFIKIGHKVALYPAEQLEQFLAERLVVPESPVVVS